MKIAILGANGVVGKFLTSRLLEHDVYPITRKLVDLLDTKKVDELFEYSNFDVVINCAANINSDLDAPTSVSVENLTMFTNIYRNRRKFGKLIQFCSGAAFDRTKSIDAVLEEDLVLHLPNDSYGSSKNIISRICLETEDCYTIRLFGVFHPGELARRLLPRLLREEPLTIYDRYFDYLYTEDLVPLVNYFITSNDAKYKDINAVYTNKHTISQFVTEFCHIHQLKHQLEIRSFTGVNYTGSGDRFESLGLPRVGIINGMKSYR